MGEHYRKKYGHSLKERQWLRPEARPPFEVIKLSEMPPKPRANASVNCFKTPALCSERLQCQTWPLPNETAAALNAKMTTQDNHANLRLWCEHPQDADTVVQHCLLNHALVAHAHASYASTKKSHKDELVASFCFIEGLCHDSAITANTTVLEAEDVCDARYGP